MAAKDLEETSKVLPSSRQPMPGSADTKPDNSNRSAAEIERELDAVTARLAANVDELVGRMHPRQLAGRGLGRAGRLVLTKDGRPRPEIVGALIGGLVGVAVLAWWSRGHR